MSSSCSYCGAPLNFGVKFCLACGRDTVAGNKMGSIKTGGPKRSEGRRPAESSGLYNQLPKESHQFRQTLRSLSQTIVYGFIAGAIFFCAIRFTIQAINPEQVSHFFAPLFQNTPKLPAKTNAVENNSGKKQIKRKSRINKRTGQ